jgi:hypothetical protein
MIWGLLGSVAIVAFAVFIAQSSPSTLTSEALADGNGFSTTAILSGRTQRNAFESFVGGEATAFMGGVELDFRGSRMQEDQAPLEVFAMMGGIDIRIPEDWEVVNDLNVIMGGIDDKTERRNVENPKRLVLHGTVLMGGLSIRN